MTGRRVLSVWIDSTAIEVGEVTPPRIGSVLHLPIVFRESSSSVDDPGVMRVQGTLELSEKRPQPMWAAGSDPAGWRWQGTLRGDGWAALWEGSRPRIGPLDLVGRFAFGWGHGSPVRGTVTRVRMASRVHREQQPGSWGPDPTASITFVDVETAPRHPHSGEPSRPVSEYAVTFAALADIDLDATPPPEPRRRFIPYHLSAGGDTVWMVDELLPSVVGLRTGDDCVEYLLPERPYVGRSVVATMSGCWVNGADAVFRIRHGAPAEKASVLRAVAAIGDVVVVRTDQTRWAVVGPDDDVRPIEMPAGVVAGHVVDGESLVVVLLSESGSAAGVQLVRVTTAGDVTVGPTIAPILPPGGVDPRWVVAGSPLRLFCGGQTAVEVLPDLSAGPRHALPEFLLSAGSAGDLVWVVTHPPDPSADGAVDRWPFPEPVTYDRSRGQFWLMTLLDAATMRPVASHPVHATRPSVTRTADGRTWLTARGLAHLPDTPMHWPVAVDVGAQITRTVDPAPPERPARS